MKQYDLQKEEDRAAYYVESAHHLGLYGSCFTQTHLNPDGRLINTIFEPWEIVFTESAEIDPEVFQEMLELPLKTS